MLRRILARILTLAGAPLTGTSVLMYHSIANGESDFITDTPADFERHMHFIKQRGLRTVFASEIPALIKTGDLANTVCVTLDDGYRNNYANAFPILKKYGIKATIFLITDLLGKSFTDSRGTTRAILTEAEVREMAASGLVEFMPHTHTHPDMRTLDDAALDAELASSKETIVRLTGKDPRVFAYPKGKYDSGVVEALQKHGFEAAFTVVPGIVRKGSGPFRLPRNPLGDVSDAELALKLSDRLDAYVALKKIV